MCDGINKVNFFYKISIVLILFILTSGCAENTAMNNRELDNFYKSSMNRDVVIIFPAWTSEDKKKQKIMSDANAFGVQKCKSYDFLVADLISYRWEGRYSMNRIGANVKCINSSLPEKENKDRIETKDKIKSITMKKAKKECVDLGFKEKSEKFGECVMELIK